MKQSPIAYPPNQSNSSSENLPPEGNRATLHWAASSLLEYKNLMLPSDSSKGVPSLDLPKRAHSLPSLLIADPATSSLGNHVVDLTNLDKEAQWPISRSFSLPENVKGRNLQSDPPSLPYVNSSSACSSLNCNLQEDAIVESHAVQDQVQDSLQEETVCRICLIELVEGELFKLECSCKGELAFAHKKCAIDWFRIKGNKTCDICKREIQNLPEILQKKCIARSASNAFLQVETINNWFWQDLPVIVLVSMLGYFILLEKLLVNDLGKQAFAISLPFSCVLGLLSSLIASVVVNRTNIWAYACLQYIVVALCAHIMYNLLRIGPMLSVLFSAFIGFGIAICANSLLKGYFASRRIPLSVNQHNDQYVQHQQPRDSLETENRDGMGYLESHR